MTALPFSRPLRIHEVPPAGLVVPIVADPAERAAIAAELDLVSLDRLEATLTVRPTRRGVRVEGEMSADVVQSCVVTLEPVAATVREAIAIAFAPPEGEPKVEIDLGTGDSDLPDPLEGDAIDLGALVQEHLALGLDPYPRLPGAVFEASAPPPSEPERRSPFADLEKLKKR